MCLPLLSLWSSMEKFLVQKVSHTVVFFTQILQNSVEMQMFKIKMNPFQNAPDKVYANLEEPEIL